MPLSKPVLIVEDDVWARLIGVVLDPSTSRERWAAFADFMSPDLPDFRGWCDQVIKAAGSLYPSDVRLVGSRAQMHDNLESAQAIVTESLSFGPQELALAPRLKAVHKYGTILRNIDVAACAARGVKVLGVRRRANIACAEHAFALMLALARRIDALNGVISIDRLPGGHRPYAPFDRRHTPGANWGASPECALSTAARSASSASARSAGRLRCAPPRSECGCSIFNEPGFPERMRRGLALGIAIWSRCSQTATGSSRSCRLMLPRCACSIASGWR